jgi:toxin-antitoxin system PIN domain toxin
LARALFDLNALIALLDSQHIHHARAMQWWAQNQSHGWASCPLTQNGFVRVVSQPNYLFPISVGDALDHLRRNIDTDAHTFWPDDISLLDKERIDHAHVLGPKQLTDIYLLALAVKHSGRLVTFDRAIRIAPVRGAKLHHLMVI